MPLLEEKQETDITLSLGDDAEKRQRRQMLVALALLLAALILVLIKDRDFWFPPAPPTQSESEPVENSVPDSKPPAEATEHSHDSGEVGCSHAAQVEAARRRARCG